MVFFLEVIEHDLTPIERKVAHKIYVEKKDKETILSEVGRTKSTYYRIVAKINKMRIDTLSDSHKMGQVK